MRCPYCSTLDNKVIDSRLSAAGEVTRRRRECEGCSRRYTTYERVEQALPMIVKKDGKRQPFSAEKLLAGLQRSCAKRPVSAEALERMVGDVQRALADTGESEVASSFVGLKVLELLRDVDQVAYVRFASVYREFQDTEEFIALLAAIAADTLEKGGDALRAASPAAPSLEPNTTEPVPPEAEAPNEPDSAPA